MKVTANCVALWAYIGQPFGVVSPVSLKMTCWPFPLNVHISTSIWPARGRFVTMGRCYNTLCFRSLLANQ